MKWKRIEKVHPGFSAKATVADPFSADRLIRQAADDKREKTLFIRDPSEMDCG